MRSKFLRMMRMKRFIMVDARNATVSCHVCIERAVRNTSSDVRNVETHFLAIRAIVRRRCELLALGTFGENLP
jgi:hypothetical protein